MKAIRVHKPGGPEVLRLEQVPDPTPGPGEVLIQVKAAGVNPVDTYVRAGQYGYTPEVPYTPGADVGGIVEAVGRNVTHVRVGDRVYGARANTGGYAEKAVCDVRHVHPLPRQLSFAQGACIGIPYVTAYAALFQTAKVQKGEWVLIHGASGGVGTAALQLAKPARVRLLATAGSEQGHALARRLGAEAVLDHRDPARFDELRQLTEGRGIDAVIEMLANKNLATDLEALAPFGRVVVVGCRGPIEIDPRQLMLRSSAILGIRLRNLPPQAYAEIYTRLGERLRDGTIQPVVTREYPLAQAAEAHRAVMTPPALGQIVLAP